mmetsp:Transcript_48203/g.103883  ORF Transcript_48203/g.103883 Transcript_48203/m.103883 type:complete len:249 (-) Transcript_48203:550-1296(-)
MFPGFLSWLWPPQGCTCSSWRLRKRSRGRAMLLLHFFLPGAPGTRPSRKQANAVTSKWTPTLLRRVPNSEPSMVAAFPCRPSRPRDVPRRCSLPQPACSNAAASRLRAFKRKQKALPEQLPITPWFGASCQQWGPQARTPRQLLRWTLCMLLLLVLLLVLPGSQFSLEATDKVEPSRSSQLPAAVASSRKRAVSSKTPKSDQHHPHPHLRHCHYFYHPLDKSPCSWAPSSWTLNFPRPRSSPNFWKSH